MLIQRTITTIVLISLILWGLIKLPLMWFSDITVIVVLWGAYEWTQFIPLKTYGAKLGYMLATVLWLFALIWLAVPSTVILSVGLLAWLDGIYLVFRKQQHRLPNRANNLYYKAWLGWVVLIPFWLSLNVLRNAFGPWWLLYGMSIVWVTDIVAYLSGRVFGKHPLASEISPKKTWEGVIGGLLGALVAGVVWNWGLALPYKQWGIMLGIVFVTAAFSIFGDLLESLLKRLVNLKDSGVLLPGHGGIMDRIDALTLGLPIFTLGVLVFL